MSAPAVPTSYPPQRTDEVRLRPTLSTWAVPVVGAIVLVILGIAVPLAIPAAPPTTAPAVVLEAEQSRTLAAADSVRKSLNEALDDLQVAARTAADGDAVQPVLDALIEQRGRYHGVAWLVGTSVQARAGDDFEVPAFPVTTQSVVLAGSRDSEPFVQLVAPVPDRPGELIAAWYDAQYLSFPLQAAGPGLRWLVDGGNRLLGSDQGFVALQPLPGPELDAAADAARADGAQATDLVAEQEVVSSAPLDGPGPAGALGWAVVTSSTYDSLALTDSVARSELFFAGLLTVLLALLLLGWFVIVVAMPLHHLALDATSVADGNLSEPVLVRRYDEVGVIARNIDRIRRTLRGELHDTSPAPERPDDQTGGDVR